MGRPSIAARAAGQRSQARLPRAGVADRHHQLHVDGRDSRLSACAPDDAHVVRRRNAPTVAAGPDISCERRRLAAALASAWPAARAAMLGLPMR